MMGRRLHSTLDLVKPDLESRVAIKQDFSKSYKQTRERGVINWEMLSLQKFGKHEGLTWVPATVIPTGLIAHKLCLIY